MKNIALPKGLFITGTDTDVGKTYIGAQIVKLLDQLNIDVIPRKPIESGCELIDETLLPRDATEYWQAVKKKTSLDEICPFRFEPAISPQRAARLANKPISLQQTTQACLNKVKENNFLVVEGAGGFYSPLCEDGLNADLAQALQLPVLLIANDQLGCINHILLTAEAIKQKNLELSAVILNDKKKLHNDSMNNFEDLKDLQDVPIFSVSKNENINIDSALAKHLVRIS